MTDLLSFYYIKLARVHDDDKKKTAKMCDVRTAQFLMI